MEPLKQSNTRGGPPRYAKPLPLPKDLPEPPPKADTGLRGKSSSIPPQNRALPSIPRRPVGKDSDGITVRSIRSISSIKSKYSVYPGLSETMNSENIPPLPTNDDGSRPDVPPKAPSHLHSLSISSIGSNSSSPQSELWRRRSVKSDNSIPISDLKLNKSNGSTSNLVTTDSPTPPPQHPLPSVPSQSARPAKKPLPSEQDKSVADVMGVKISKGSNLGLRVVSTSGDKGKSGEKPTETQQSPVNRLPTPEYQPFDKSLSYQVSPQVCSPTAPETPPSIASPDLVAHRAEQKSASDAPAVQGSIAPPKAPDHRNLLPSLRATQQSEPTIIIAQPVVTNSPQPHKPRTSSLLGHKPAASLASLSAGAQGSSAPSTKPPTACLKAAALTIVHLDCYQAHRQLRPSRNDICPLQCMICEVKDLDKRWVCNFCSLRCCDRCMKGLASSPGKDLRKFLENIGRADRIREAEKLVEQ
jgi:hypothetical protein